MESYSSGRMQTDGQSFVRNRGS